MKAEHRKELQTNALADAVGGFLKGAKSYAGAVWALVLIGIVIYGFYWWYSSNYSDRIALAWIDFLNATEWSDPKALGESEQLAAQAKYMEETADRRRATTAEMPSRLRAADYLYRKGYGKLDDIPSAAKEDMAAARTVYEAIRKNPGEAKDVGLRALSAIAKTYESTGEIDKAIETYQQILTEYGKHFRAGSDGSAHPLILDAERALAFFESDIGRQLYKDWLTRHGVSPPDTPPGGRTPENVPDRPIEPPPPP